MLLDSKTYRVYNYRLADCQDRINTVLEDLNKELTTIASIQLTGTLSVDERDPMLWIEDLASATQRCKELKMKLASLKEQRALLVGFLKDTDEALRQD